MNKIKVLTIIYCLMFGLTTLAQVKFGAQAVIGLPSDDFLNAVSAGFGGNANFELISDNRFAFTCGLGYIYFASKSNMLPGADYYLTITPVNIGMRYYFYQERFKPYCGTELGLSIVSETAKIWGMEETNSKSDFSFAPLVGFKYSISHSLDFELTLKFDIITSDPTTPYVGIHSGISIEL